MNCNTEKYITETERDLLVVDDVDVIVCGAGPAGIAAAITAARSGAKTRLFELHGCLGGVWTAGMLTWLFEMNTSELAMEIGRKLDARNARYGEGYYNYSYNIEEMKLLCEELCIEAGVDIRLHTRVVETEVKNSHLTAIITESKSGREAWKAKTFIDCTGDGDLAASAGCEFDLGGDEGQMQPWTLMGMIALSNVEDIKEFVYNYKGTGEFLESQERFKAVLMSAGIETSYGHPTIFQVNDNLCALMVNHEYGYSALNADDLTKATINARKELSRVVKGLKALGGKWEGVTLAATADQIGIREGRRIRGLYKLTKQDLMEGALFHDGICTVSFNIDIHSSNPEKDKGLKTEQVKPYQIPYRSLVAKDVNGLLMAGRCISGDWMAHASYRVTGCAVATGEAAGAAAALSASSGVSLDQLEWKDIERTKIKPARKKQKKE